jgi:hypothetical protein
MIVSPRAPNRIGVAADHGGCELKHHLVKKLQEAGYDVIDFGNRQPKQYKTKYSQEIIPMAQDFKVGDHVEWNSEAGRVRGKIKKSITSAITFKGYTVHASKEDPQYLIKSDKTDHMAMHKGSALTRISKSTPSPQKGSNPKKKMKRGKL